jgi:formyltetrahydrofolate synthetase
MSEFLCLEPVPSDIQISQAVNPVHIASIAENCGIGPDEYELYGITKAKVHE